MERGADGGLRLRRGSLWPAVERAVAEASRSGDLQPIATRWAFVEDAGVRFQVRVLERIAVKDRALEAQESALRAGRDFNPFLPYEPAMFVADVSATHLCLLNKYPVLDHHALIVTRDFEEQQSALTLRDFEALCVCLAEAPALGFHNSGKISGASQRHKHLQLVRLPLVPGGPDVPIEPLLQEWRPEEAVAPGLPFSHAFVRWEPGWIRSASAAERGWAEYGRLLSRIGAADGQGRPVRPYNLLVTQEWMMLVPRSGEGPGGVSVNSLGFAGALLVRTEQDLERVRAEGPLRLLRSAVDG